MTEIVAEVVVEATSMVAKIAAVGGSTAGEGVEATSTADEGVAKAVSAADKGLDEATSTVAEVVAKAASTVTEIAAEAASTVAEVVAAAASTRVEGFAEVETRAVKGPTEAALRTATIAAGTTGARATCTHRPCQVHASYRLRQFATRRSLAATLLANVGPLFAVEGGGEFTRR